MSVAKDLQKIVVLAVVILIAGGLFYYLGFFEESPEGEEYVACTQDAKQCPDGSYVGRIAPDCEFAECPAEEEDESVMSEEPVINSETITEPAGWTTYTNDEWKFSFEYPSNYIVTEELEGVKVIVSPPEGEFEGPWDWFMVWVVQNPSEELLDGKELHEYLFYRANLPNGELAWLKDEKFFKFEDHFISREDITLGENTDYEAMKIRETSIQPELGEYRSIVYVLRDPVIYQVTHDLSAEEAYGDTLKRVEDSFTVLP